MATVTEITVHASAGFNHPYERFANFKPGVTLRATLGPDENIWVAVRNMQDLADSLVQAEKEAILDRLEAEERGIGENEDDDQESFELEESDVEF